MRRQPCERRLPVDRAHNGLLVLSDGSIVTKDLRLAGQGRSTITRLHPDELALLGDPLVLPEGSMGRIAADIDAAGNEFIYIPGIERVWRMLVGKDRLELDESWSPRYRDANGEQGLSWDGCLADGALWLMDNGDIDSLRAIYGQHPNGRFDTPGASLSWRRHVSDTGHEPGCLLLFHAGHLPGCLAVNPKRYNRFLIRQGRKKVQC